MDQKYIDRFWKKVNKRSVNECWNWIACKDGSGYGTAWNGKRKVGAHRFSYELHIGPIPDGLLVRHKCHNRVCVNPKHLKIGDHDDNMKDMVDADRQAKGIDIGNSKLTEQDVLKIRQRYESGETQTSIAKDFEIYKGTVSRIVNRERWKHI